MMNYYTTKSNNLLLMLKNFLKFTFLLIFTVSISSQEKKPSHPIQKNDSVELMGNQSHLQRNIEETFDTFMIQQEEQNRINSIKNVVILILVASLIGLYLFYNSKQKKQFAKFKNIIRNQKSINFSYDKEVVEIDDFSNISVVEVGQNDDVKRRNESLMTSETETKLLELLEDFEKGNLYNNKNMSLPFLAGELNTNTKYLSYVINQYKSSDFKTYVNRLRVNYIVNKLIGDEKYRQYKISILADECGFSSHSKFASVFKAVTDFSPSAFIKHLEDKNH
ncbi:AraC family transcriptional regulator [Chryseobacterium sp. MYb264]|uniref:helix-turn-helix domain-containing protein n=1 Tax=Chryseobacterium sp. MYb264 TaxID=2745153 RepID=UPI002E0E9A74|nr:AraC family transcriptional regulator [Chryseobacterium sp. MYb264]